ncbi:MULTISPECIES: inositol monophosphatase family protein [Rhodomicrobium]|uniref:inositol monophosphatase family protein n=1 Tax=Rhodomicrobium TaxID=1068 RepID=UPI000B4A94B0|nr:MULTISPECIES: inositol monophosphatase family protein [Rhodomicrobium]
MAASALMTMMFAAARKAGRSLARDFGEVEQLQVSMKGPGNFVTAADHRAEQILYDELSKARHGYSFLMEERGLVEGPDKTHVWIIDPLDGTTNFLHGIPHFAISIALQREGELVAGIIYNPANGDIFTAERGKGAFLNDRRIRVAARSRLEDCVVATGIPHRGKGDHEIFLKQLAAVMPSVSGIRRTGAAALDLAWVAAGRYDGYWEQGIQAWDMAAGLVLLREAGGFASDLKGGKAMLETGSILAGNESVHRALAKLL